MRQMVFLLRLVAVLAFFYSVSTFAEETVDSVEQKLEQLNQKIEQLEQKLQKQESLTLSKNTWRERIRFNGFASFGVSKVSGNAEDESYYYGQRKDVSVLPNTWLGLRIDTLLYSGGELVAQFVAKTGREDNLEIRTEWLFLKQDIAAGFSAHLGRIRFPVHIDSEVIYVGNVYPTVMPSAEIYSVLSMNHLDGISLNHILPLGDTSWVMDSKVILWGQGKDLRSGLSFRLKDVQGMAISFSNDALTTRLAAFTAKKILDIHYPMSKELPNGLRLRVMDRLDYLTAAVRFDNQKLYGSLEGITIRAHNNRVDEIQNWNAIAGVYVGPSLLYVGYARQQTVNAKKMAKEVDLSGAAFEAAEPFCPPTISVNNGLCSIPAGREFAQRYNRQQKNLQLGMKYNITPRVVLKGQAQMLHGFKGTRGVFEYNDTTYLNKRERIYIYDIAVQAFF